MVGDPRAAHASGHGPAGPRPAAVNTEVTTVSDDDVVMHRPAAGDEPAAVFSYSGLEPDTEYDFGGISARTLPRPAGELLARVATVNDVHFGETAAGIVAGTDVGPVLSSEPGEDPYPLLMNRAAVVDISEWAPDLVVAKGDLTDAGRSGDFKAFTDCYSVFGSRLVVLPGNHDVAGGPLDLAAEPFGGGVPGAVDLPGVTVAILDTTIPRAATGRISPEQLEWLDELGARADRPVLVMGHHQPWGPGSRVRSDEYFGIRPADSESLVDVFSRRRRLAGYFAGHTHRNRVRRFDATGTRPFVEVASVKEFPGVWAEYRVYEGGILQVVRRIGGTAALRWSERTRALYSGTYTDYAFGTLADRCFRVV
ncbi:MAG: metallophosphoesterase family protein [Acidimicrobiales bacterium]